MNKKKSKKFHNSFKGRLIIGILSLTILMVLTVAFISFRLADKKIKEMAILQSESNLRLAESALASYYSEILEWSTEILQLPEVREAAESVSAPSEVLNNILWYKKLINAIPGERENSRVYSTLGLYLLNGDCYVAASGKVFPFSGFNEAFSFFDLGDPSDSRYIPAFFTVCPIIESQTGSEQKRLVYVRLIYERLTMRKLGLLVFEIQNDSVIEKISYISNDSVLISPNGIVMASKDPSMIGTYYSNRALVDYLTSNGHRSGTLTSDTGLIENAQILSYCTVFGNDCILITPFEYYSGLGRAEANDYLQSVLMLVVLSLTAAALFAILLSNGLSSSVRRIVTFVKHINTEEGKFSERIEVNGNDEIAYLGEKINDMLDRIETSAKEREIDLKNQQIMELRLMQSQINPHLLYNTLDSVLWAIQNDNTENAIELIASLSGFFRIALSRGVERIPLKKEIQLIETYITIQKLARGQNVTLIKEIPDCLLDHSIIKLTLQPLVENSYLHGFSGYRDDGTIRIRACHENDLLIISVEDNGIGMLPEEVENINSYIKSNTIPQKSRSVGLYNVNRRIVHEYGKEYGLHLCSEPSEFTVITVTLPYQQSQSEE